MLDVIVAGGGPIGSRAAFQLAEKGYRVAILEKRSGPGEKPCCTGIISQECVDRFSIPSSVIYRQVNSAKIFAPSGEAVKVHRPEPQASIVNRAEFDRFLALQAQLKGAKYYPDCHVDGLSIKTDRVIVDYSENDQDKQLESKAVIIASGFYSPLAKILGLGCPGYFVAGAQAEVDAGNLEEVEVYFNKKVAPGFFAWLVPTSEGKALAGLMSRRAPGQLLREWLKYLESQRKILSGNYQIRYGGIPLKPIRRTFAGRLLVIGDAAGQVKPTTGGGLYFGLICADIAATTLHNALQSGNLSSSGLSVYQRDWRRKLNSELRREYYARKIFERLNDKQINRLVSALNSTGLIESLLLDKSLSFDWHGGLMLRALRLGLLSQFRKMLHLPLTSTNR